MKLLLLAFVTLVLGALARIVWEHVRARRAWRQLLAAAAQPPPLTREPRGPRGAPGWMERAHEQRLEIERHRRECSTREQAARIPWPTPPPKEKGAAANAERRTLNVEHLTPEGHR